MICTYFHSYRAGEPLDYGDRGRVTNWAEWEESMCTHSSAMEGEACPYLDDNSVECSIKEGQIGHIQDFAIRTLAGDREDQFAKVHELMMEVDQ